MCCLILIDNFLFFVNQKKKICQYIGGIAIGCEDELIERKVFYRFGVDIMDIMLNICKCDKMQEMNVY